MIVQVKRDSQNWIDQNLAQLQDLFLFFSSLFIMYLENKYFR